MITVRFPNGQAVQYNTATYVTRSQFGYSDLYTKENDAWIAQVPNTCLIEIVSPCRVYNAVEQMYVDVIKSQLADLTKEVRSLRRKVSGK